MHMAVATHAVGANQDWEVRDILGKKVIDGKVYYLVYLEPTLVPEDSLLETAKELADEFEARLRAQFDSKNGRGRPSLKPGERVTVGGDAPFGKTPQKTPRGRPGKKV
jgi:hypothetical protein